MILSKKQFAEFEEASKPLMKFLAKNCHPHVKVILENNRAELLEGSANTINDEFILD